MRKFSYMVFYTLYINFKVKPTLLKSYLQLNRGGECSELKNVSESCDLEIPTARILAQWVHKKSRNIFIKRSILEKNI